MSMFNPDFDGGAQGQHHVGPPTRGTTRETPGVAKPYTGAPGESRGTDETMGTGIGGTLSDVGVPPPTPPTTDTSKATGGDSTEPSGTTKAVAGVKEMGEQAVSWVTEAVDKVNQKIK